MSRPLKTRVVGALYRLTGLFGGGPQPEGLYRCRVLGGPLRGSFIHLLAPDRPSYVLGRFEPHVVEAIEARLPVGGVAYDVGSYVGYLSMVMSKRVGATGSVYAFEAYPRVVEALHANISQGGFENAAIVRQAVGDSDDPVRFATFDYSTVGHIARESTPDDATMLEVAGTTLDRFVYGEGNPPPDLVKIDVNGAELSVLAGADRLFREHPPHVLVEVRSSTEAEVTEHMTSRGFECTRLTHERQAQIDLFNLVFSPAA